MSDDTAALRKAEARIESLESDLEAAREALEWATSHLKGNSGERSIVDASACVQCAVAKSLCPVHVVLAVALAAEDDEVDLDALPPDERVKGEQMVARSMERYHAKIAAQHAAETHAAETEAVRRELAAVGIVTKGSGVAGSPPPASAGCTNTPEPASPAAPPWLTPKHCGKWELAQEGAIKVMAFCAMDKGHAGLCNEMPAAPVNTGAALLVATEIVRDLDLSTLKEGFDKTEAARIKALDLLRVAQSDHEQEVGKLTAYLGLANQTSQRRAEYLDAARAEIKRLKEDVEREIGLRIADAEACNAAAAKWEDQQSALRVKLVEMRSGAAAFSDSVPAVRSSIVSRLNEILSILDSNAPEPEKRT